MLNAIYENSGWYIKLSTAKEREAELKKEIEVLEKELHTTQISNQRFYFWRVTGRWINLTSNEIKEATINIIHRDSKRRYDALLLDLKKTAEEYTYSPDAAKRSQKGRKWGAYYQAENAMADYTYPYASTTRRLQGETCGFVFVDYSDIMSIMSKYVF